MKTIIKFIVLTTLWNCGGQPKVAPTKPELVIISDNETGNPMLFAIEENYKSLGQHQQISLKPADTIIFRLVNRYEYLYISHKGSYGDTLMVATGDTLRVRTDKDGLFHFDYTGSARDAIASFQIELNDFVQSREMQ